MHGFARPTLRIEENDAIAQKPFCGSGNMVENRMLQIQHTDGNELLTRLNEALKFQHFGDFAPMAARFAVINSAKWADETPPWT
ncbi:hypothetical protein [Devosia sp.]|uniref:hypothetical protein n=1 Tax=Devosia sp. TaxID=1871048 RepID=UPI00292FA4C2|nr:hypothetical protein [Devosia sp.]